MLTLWGPRARHHTGLKAVVCAPKCVGATSSSVYTKCFGLLLLTSKVLLECIKFLANLKKTRKKTEERDPQTVREEAYTIWKHYKDRACAQCFGLACSVKANQSTAHTLEL
jgi:hypothetical protein